MKFIARKGAPDIPLELIEAQENSKLVFFCGAGVSYPAGLPDFRGLVEGVYSGIPDIADELEEQAIKAGYYDRALGLLENRKGKSLVRHQIISQLRINDGANLNTHRALLQLSRTNTSHYRLVTTNVDHGFVLAGKDLSLRSDSAPKLPVPKPHKWASAVHLHGLIDDGQDPEGDHLVFTSGDFGSAYLTERWASKFVTELFVNFTVVFVGYSINDPVIRYMTDAIAAERRQDDGLFNLPYVIADTTEKNRDRSIRDWRAKGVEPVLYIKGGKKHPNLHNSLKAWAAHSRDGLSSKQRIINTKARLAPVPPYDQDESIKQVLDTLKERTDKNNEKVTGHPAKIFAGLDDPPAPIKWLPLLHGEGLLSISKINKQSHIINSDPVASNLTYPNKISNNLWSWLLHHLEDDIFIRWVIDQGVCLHPSFKEMVVFRLRKSPPAEPYLSFWKIITSDNIRCCHSSSIEGSDVIRGMIRGADQLTNIAFLKLLEPSYEVTKSFYWPDDDCEDSVEQGPPYSIGLEIGLKDWAFSNLKEADNYPEEYTYLIRDVTQSLNMAMELLAFIDRADDKHDRSHWDIISIEPHDQNHRDRALSHLVELCRDLWGALYQQDKAAAKQIVFIWQNYRYPIFRRLCLYAYKLADFISQDEKIDYLLEDDGWWLWSVCTTREVYRLLDEVWPNINDDKESLLLASVVKGPPRIMYRDDLSEEDFQGRLDRERWLMLAKLQSYGRDLSGEGLELFNSLSVKYPRWRLQEGDRDEFNHWFSTGVGNDTDIDQEALFNLPLPERIEKLSEENQRFHEGRIDVFRFSGKERLNDVVETLFYMFSQEIWHARIWHAGLTGIADSEKNVWSQISSVVARLPDEIYESEAWAIAWWARKTVKSIDARSSDEEALWLITRRLLEINGSTDIELDDDDDAVNIAINNPVGIITEAVLDRLQLYGTLDDGGLPRPEPFALLNTVMVGAGGYYDLGRVILFSRLMYFYAVETAWTRERLIPLLSPEVSEKAKIYWEGYIWNPRISADLAIDLKSTMLISLERNILFGRDLEGLVKLFTFSFLQYPDLYTNKEIQRALRSMGTDGLAFSAELMWRSLADEEDSKGTFWENRIKPILRNTWPKGDDYLDENISQELALLALQLDDQFPEAVKIISPMLSPINDKYLVLNQFSESAVIEDYPGEAFQLLVGIFNADNNWNNDILSDLLVRFVAADGKLRTRQEFINIENFVTLSQI